MCQLGTVSTPVQSNSEVRKYGLPFRTGATPTYRTIIRWSLQAEKRPFIPAVPKTPAAGISSPPGNLLGCGGRHTLCVLYAALDPSGRASDLRIFCNHHRLPVLASPAPTTGLVPVLALRWETLSFSPTGGEESHGE